MQANIKWLDDPEVFRVNQLPAHSDHPFLRIIVNGKIITVVLSKV